TALTFFSPDGNAMLWDTRQSLTRWSYAENQVQPVSLPVAGRRTSWTTLPSQGLASCGVAPQPVSRPGDENVEEEDAPAIGSQGVVCPYPRWSVLARLDHPDLFSSIAFSPAGGRLVSLPRDNPIRLWDWRHQQQVALTPAPSRPAAVAVLPD